MDSELLERQLSEYGRQLDAQIVALERADVQQLAPEPPARRGWLIALGAAVVTVVALGVVAWLAPLDSDTPPAQEPSVVTTLPEQVTVPEPEALPRVTDTIRVDGGFNSFSAPVATDGAVWVGGGKVTRVDSSTRQVTDTIDVGGDSNNYSLFATADAVWVVSESVSRIGLDTREVTDTIRTGTGTSQAAVLTDGALWVSSEEKGLIEIDLATRQIINEYQIPVPLRTTANDYQIVNPTFRAKWADEIDGAIWSWAPGQLIRFDIESREFTAVFDLPVFGYTEECCIATDDAIWLVSNEGKVWRFDIATLEVTDKLNIGVGAQAGFDGLSSGIAAAGAIWIPSGGDDSVYRIDQTTREVTDVIQVGDTPTRTPVFADGAIWVPAIGNWPDDDTGTVTRIDIDTLQVTHTFEVGSFPQLPMGSDGAIWIPTVGDSALTRIQTRP